MRSLSLILALAVLPGAALPNPALSAGLNCTFTTLCSPLTDCQNHPGVPFRFNLISGAHSFMTPTGMVFGTPLSHLDPSAAAILFEIGSTGTLLLTLTQSGEAVMTQQDVLPAGTVQSISYFGTCEPGA